MRRSPLSLWQFWVILVAAVLSVHAAVAGAGEWWGHVGWFVTGACVTLSFMLGRDRGTR